MADHTIIHTESYRRGAIEYEISVVDQGGSLYGRWTCKACGLSGTNSVPDSLVHWAVWSAKTILSGHHGLIHLDGSATGSGGV